MSLIHKNYYKPPPPARSVVLGLGEHQHKRIASPLDYYHKTAFHHETATPAIVAQFGAKCSSESPSISMLDARQQPLMTPLVKQTLQYYCNAAKQAQTRDMSHLKPTSLYWKGDESTGIVTVLGIKRGLRVYDLLSNSIPPKSEPAHDFKVAKAFGKPIGNSPWAVFLDDTDGERLTFRFGQIMNRVSDPGTKVILAGKKEYTVFTSLIAPAALSLAPGHKLQHLPPNGKGALAKITRVLGECGHDQYVRSRLMDAKGALEVTKRLNNNGKLGQLAIQQLHDAADKLRYAAVHMRQSGTACPAGTAAQTYIHDIDEAIALMNILACRAVVSDLQHKPDILYSASDEDFIRELTDILHEGESFDQSALKCMSIMKKFRPGAVQAARQSGIAIDSRSALEESFDAIEEKCATSTHEPHDRKSAQSHLMRLAKDKNSNMKLWRTALTLNSGKLSHSCKDAAEQLFTALNQRECRNEYLRILREHGQSRDDSHAVDTQSLANEVLVLIDSKETSSKALDDGKVAECLLQDESNISEHMEAKLRAAGPSRQDAAILAEIDKDEAIQLQDIAEAQKDLKTMCERADHPTQINNPILRGTSSSGLLAPLLAHGGKIDLIEASKAASEIEKDLEVADPGETEPEKDARLNCRRFILDFEKDVRNRRCTIRIMRKLSMPPSAKNDTQRYREKLAKLWRRRFGEAKGDEDGQEKELDELCAQSLSPVATGIEQRASVTSARQCSDPVYMDIVRTFCTRMAALRIPVNFLDFLSILSISVLPQWPYNLATMQKIWLPARQVAMKHEDGSRIVCDNSNLIIEMHAQTAEGSATAFSSRNEAVTELLQKLSNGASLSELSKCACTSKDVMTAEQRQDIVQTTSWYWKCGEALITGGADDARLITSARQILVTKILDATLQTVSLRGTATLKQRQVGDPSIIVIIWNTYLQLMFGGVLDPFRRRIINKHKTHTSCIMAMIDTFFYVVLLDLHDVSQSTTPDTHIIDMAGLSVLSKKNAAIGALGLAVLGKVAGTVLDEEAFETVTDKAIEGVAQASTSLLQATVQEIVRGPEQTLAQKHKHADPQERAVTRGYKKLFSNIFPFKKGSVNDVLIQLCMRDLHLNTNQGAVLVSPLEHARDRQEKLEYIMAAPSREVIDRTKLAAPLCFPLSPPGASDPPKTCLGIC